MKIYYYNDEKHGVALAVNDLHYTRLVPAQQIKMNPNTQADFDEDLLLQ
mgnify:CR=1 FL=1